jgi:hypothetical protein
MLRWFFGPEATKRRADARADVRRLEYEVDLEWAVLRETKNPNIKRRQVPMHRELTRAHMRQARAESRHISLGLFAVLAVTGANVLAFHLLGSNYFAWWLDSGAVASVFFLFLATVTDLDEHPDLISQDPWGFVEALFIVCAELTAAWATTLVATAPDADLEGGPGSGHRSFLRWRTMDGAITMLFSVGLAVVLAFWILVVAPAQYWTNLICGAPARQALTSTETVWVHVRPNEGPGTKGQHISIVTAPRNQAPPVGARMSALLTKPVSLTAALSAGVLLALKVLL